MQLSVWRGIIISCIMMLGHQVVWMKSSYAEITKQTRDLDFLSQIKHSLLCNSPLVGVVIFLDKMNQNYSQDHN